MMARPGTGRATWRRARLVVVGAVWLAAGSAGAVPPGSTPREIELGQEAAEDIEKSMELVDDEEKLAKLQKMLDEIAIVTPRPEIRYKPHIVSTPIVNAFVVPGGWVYVTTGLLDTVESDDELAGVLCHEIAHNVDQHAIRRMREAPKGLGLLQLASLAALVIGRSPEAALLASVAANAITAAVLNGYTVPAEVEADADGLEYMVRTSYNPTGFLTFMERMAGGAGKFFEEELGYDRTHPLTRDRVHAAKERLEELGIPIRRRLVTRAPQPEAHPIEIDAKPVTEITFEGKRLLLLAGHDEERTRGVVASVAWVLDQELTEEEIAILPRAREVVFRPKGGPSCVFTAADGDSDGAGDVALAGRLRARLASLVADAQARQRANYQLY